jgi:hypothetical protein
MPSTPRSELKATTPDDARLWVREFDDPDGGTVVFLAETLKNDLTSNRGYAFRTDSGTMDATGRPGIEQTYETAAGGEPHGYLVAVFVVERTLRDNLVRVAEFAAPKPVFDEHVESIRTAIGTLR